MQKTPLQFLFYEIDSNEALSRFAGTFDSHYINDTIIIPAEHGTGMIRRFPLEQGLNMRVVDLLLNKPLIVNKASDCTSSDKIFHITWLLNPTTLRVNTDGRGVEKKSAIQECMNILFTSNDIDCKVELETVATVQAIDISFTSSWLLESFSDAGEDMKEFIAQALKSPVPTVFLESTSAAEYRILSQLHESAINAEHDSLLLRAGALSLMAGFFTKIYMTPIPEAPDTEFFYYEKMMQVEKLLSRHLQKPLPSIDTIARQVALSESSLKRHFKQMFGKSIYEYYLELKMDYAKRLLLDKALSVNEVAAMLDYERVSSFIDMFKRFHGVPPGTLRKKVG